MKIAMLQLNFTVGDLRGNAEKILDGYRKAVEQGAELVVSTELGIFGYPPKDMLEISSYVDEQLSIFRDVIKPQIGEVGLIVGVADRNGNNGKPLFNRAFLVRNGDIIDWETKTLLPTYDVFDEDRYFEPNSISNAIVITYNGLRLGMLICEDIWAGDEDSRGLSLYQHDPVEKFVGQKVDILIVPNGSPYYWGKGNVRYDLVKKIAQKLSCTVVYVNQVGGNDELVFDGRSFAINKFGDCIAAAKPFEEDLVVFATKRWDNAYYPFDKDQYTDLYNALVLGVRDYLTKIGAAEKGALVAISGGIDSAVVAKIAVDAIGADKVLGVSLPSSFSSEGSIADAKELAKNLGIELPVVPIAEVYNVFGETVKGEIDWKLPGSTKGDVTEENVQARIRGMIMMAFSNRTGRIVLTTGNKSEIAVGYCTLYGDMVGGLAVIADLPKTLVYGLAGYINRERNQIPESIIKKAPSAELAPGQKDEDSLPPYPILDGILHMFVEEKRGLKEIVEAGFVEETVRWVIRAVTRNEFKRQQMSPGIKVTSKAFGSGRRFPIAAKYVLSEKVEA